MDQRAIIEAHNLTAGYREGGHNKEVVRGLNFTLNRGEMTCFLGINGVGKSTVLRTIAGTQPQLHGSILLEGREIKTFSQTALSKKIGIVLTDKPQVGGLTVRELVGLGRQPHTGFFGRLTGTDKKAILRAMEAVGIIHKADTYTAHLSDGERQKVMIAKALVQECPIILLDEPTAFLDVASRIEMMSLLHSLAYEQNKAILLTTHDIEQTLQMADKLWILTPEKELLSGTTEDIVFRGAIDRLFPDNGVTFDRSVGIFYPNTKLDREIRLIGTDKTLLHWGRNALARKGYKCVSTPCKLTVELHSPDHLCLSTPQETSVYTSFHALLSAL